jgi:DNA polymerase-3 subunit alpha
MSFVHLHVHSAYSLLDGAIKIKDLVDTAKGMGMPAVGLTDHGQMFGVYKFYMAAREKGVKPIVGVETYVSPDRKSREKNDPRYHLVLLAQDLAGYRNLIELITLANTEGFYYKPRVDYELLKKYNGGLIALTACLQGELPCAVPHGSKLLKESLQKYQDIFGDRLYLEIQENEIPAQTIVNQALMDLSRETGVPLVATNDCHYLKKEDYDAHDILLCIQTNAKVQEQKRMRMPFNTYYFRSPEEMRALFHYCPEACDNTLKIAERCDLVLPKKVYHFPKIKALDGTTPEETLISLSRKGLEDYFQKRESLGKPLDEDKRQEYRARLEEEIKIINDVGFAGYFLIVSDFIRWAKDHAIPVGPGRGSAAGSLVAFALKITNVDPIRFDLLFERFLNPERVSMPDIDVDFCAEGRAEVLDYVIETYGGPDHVAQILTLGQLKARGVIRDVGRALDMPLSEVDHLAKLVPMSPTITLDKALKEEPRLKELYEKDPKVRNLIGYAKTLEGLPRHASIHASGVVIADKPLTEYLPLFSGAKKLDKADGKGLTVTQFECAFVEALGLIKFDFLGLKTLTLIKHCLRLLSERGVDIDIDAIDLDDEQTFQFFRTGNLNGIFQMEQEGIRQDLRNIRPDKIDDIMSLLALYRPGPLKSGQADQFVAIRRGQAVPKYVSESLRPILEETNGVILYQEQVLRMAQVLANFSLGEADILRRAIGKKHKEDMDKMKPDFIRRCLEKGLVDERTATTIFEQLEKFAEYGFNKSHSAAYALVSYQTAWLKCRYPVEFMAALMTSEMADKEKIAGLIHECRVNRVEVLPPDVNMSGYKFTVRDAKILFGLGAIKGVGLGAIEAIIEARKKKPFTDFFDFCDRVIDKKVNKKVIEALILSGALDASGGESRAVMLASLEGAINRKKDSKKSAGLVYKSLFDDPGDDPCALNWAPAEPLTEIQRLAHEKDYLGFYVTGHPLSRYETAARAMGLDSIQQVLKLKGQGPVRIFGTISGVKIKTDKKGKPFAFATMEDIGANAEIIMWSRTLAKFREMLAPDRVVVVEGTAEPPSSDSMYGTKVIVGELWDLEEEMASRVRSVTFSVPLDRLGAFSDFLAKQGPAANGGGPVFYLKIRDQTGYGIYQLDKSPRLSFQLLDEAAGLLPDVTSLSCSFTEAPFERAFRV